MAPVSWFVHDLFAAHKSPILTIPIYKNVYT